jgi:hypothetical protein
MFDQKHNKSNAFQLLDQNLVEKEACLCCLFTMMLDLSSDTCILNLSCNMGKQNYYVANSEWITMGL